MRIRQCHWITLYKYSSIKNFFVIICIPPTRAPQNRLHGGHRQRPNQLHKHPLLLHSCRSYFGLSLPRASEEEHSGGAEGHKFASYSVGIRNSSPFHHISSVTSKDNNGRGGCPRSAPKLFLWPRAKSGWYSLSGCLLLCLLIAVFLPARRMASSPQMPGSQMASHGWTTYNSFTASEVL